jgi:hypothetical protein
MSSSGCDFFRPIDFAEEHLRTGALGRHHLYLFFYLRNFVASASLANAQNEYK